MLKKITAFILITALILPNIALAEIERVNVDEYSKKKQVFTTVDLRSFANRGFADDVEGDGMGGWTDQGAVNDMSPFTERGRVRFKGVEFDIIEPKTNNGKSAVILRGQKDEKLPNEISIDVGKKCQGIYFLHTAPWLNSTEDVGEYVLQYDDGTSHSIPVRGNREIFNWWGIAKSDEAVIGWEGNNSSSLVSLDIFPVENPFPDKEIKKITAKSIGVGPYLALTAITLTDSGPYMPFQKDKDIGNPDTSDWFPCIACEDPDLISGTALDMSGLLDAPAGKHGYLKADGEHFVFEDGTPTRFWGVAMAGESIYMNQEDAAKTAERVAQLGFNIVRFHIIDGGYSQLNGGSTVVNHSVRRTNMLSNKNMDKLCYLLSELKKRGIYYNFDLSTGGTLFFDDNYQDADKLDHGTRGPNFFDPDAVKRWDTYAEQLLSYPNPYTKMTIGEDPAFAFAALYNETSLFMLNFPWDYYYPELKNMYNEWLKKKYPTREALKNAWTEPESDGRGLQEGEDQFKGSVEVYGVSDRKKANNRRYEDNMSFIGDVQLTNFTSRFEKIRDNGCKALLTGSTTFVSGSDDAGNIYANIKAGDYYSSQVYLYLPTGNGETAYRGTTISKPTSLMNDSTLKLLGYISTRKVFGKPYLVTEWDGSMPNPYNSELMLMMPSLAGMQNWNPFLFVWGDSNYSVRKNTPLEKKYMYRVHSLMDRPVTQAALPAGAMIALRGDVKEADQGYYPVRLQNDEMYTRGNQKISNDAYLAMVGKTGVAIDDVRYDPDYNSNTVLRNAKYGKETGQYVSVTGEMMTDISNQKFLLNTPMSQGAAGYIGSAELDDIIFDIDNEFATVYLSSLSNDAIADTDRMLLTLTGNSRNSGQVMSEDGTTFIEGGEGPVIAEQIKGKMTLKSYDEFEVWALDLTGARKEKVPTVKNAEGFTEFYTTAKQQALNYEIERVKKGSDKGTIKKISLSQNIPENDFTDLGKWETQKDKIERIYLQGYMKEIAPGRFKPDDSITRGQFTSIMMDIAGLSADDGADFRDVTANNAYYKQISAAQKYGIISGDENNCFRPDEAIKKQDALLIMDKAMKNSHKYRQEKSKEASIPTDTDSYAVLSVKNAIEKGYTEDIDTTTAQELFKRAEACILLYNILWK